MNKYLSGYLNQSPALSGFLTENTITFYLKWLLFFGTNGPRVKNKKVKGQVSNQNFQKPLIEDLLLVQNFGHSSFQTRIIPTFVSFFKLSDPLFWLWVHFQVPRPKDGKNQFHSQKQNFMLDLLKKKSFKNIKYC